MNLPKIARILILSACAAAAIPAAAMADPWGYGPPGRPHHHRHHDYDRGPRVVYVPGYAYAPPPPPVMMVPPPRVVYMPPPPPRPRYYEPSPSINFIFPLR